MTAAHARERISRTAVYAGGVLYLLYAQTAPLVFRQQYGARCKMIRLHTLRLVIVVKTTAVVLAVTDVSFVTVTPTSSSCSCGRELTLHARQQAHNVIW